MLQATNKFKEDGKPQPRGIYNMYGVHAVPTQILITPEGVIVARFGSGGESYEQLDTNSLKYLKEGLPGQISYR